MEINAKWENVAALKKGKKKLKRLYFLSFWLGEKNSYFNVWEIENPLNFLLKKESWDWDSGNVYDLKFWTLNLIAFFQITRYVNLKFNF